jgi:O-acetyl-ADP-ribose deacetylase (regulator of RNase III)
MRISLFAGDIAEAHADAICTSTNPRLTLVMGTGAAVRSQGGFEILRECEGIVAQEGALAAGSVRATTAGNLGAKVILHCVASDTRHLSSESVIEACVRNALALAERHGCRSVAMPLFGAGHARLPLRRVVEVMAKSVRDSGSNIEHVTFVVFEPERADEVQAILRKVIGEHVPITRSQLSATTVSPWWSDDDRFL